MDKVELRRKHRYQQCDGTFHNSLTDPEADCYYRNIPEDVDYITIYLGINDSHHEHGHRRGS